MAAAMSLYVHQRLSWRNLIEHVRAASAHAGLADAPMELG